MEFLLTLKNISKHDYKFTIKELDKQIKYLCEVESTFNVNTMINVIEFVYNNILLDNEYKNIQHSNFTINDYCKIEITKLPSMYQYRYKTIINTFKGKMVHIYYHRILFDYKINLPKEYLHNQNKYEYDDKNILSYHFALLNNNLDKIYI